MYLLARTVLWETAVLHLGSVDCMRYPDLNTGSAHLLSTDYKEKHTYKCTHKSIIFIELYCIRGTYVSLYVKLKTTKMIFG